MKFYLLALVAILAATANGADCDPMKLTATVYDDYECKEVN